MSFDYEIAIQALNHPKARSHATTVCYALSILVVFIDVYTNRITVFLYLNGCLIAKNGHQGEQLTTDGLQVARLTQASERPIHR